MKNSFFSKMAIDRGISLLCFFLSRGYFGSLKWLEYGCQLILIGISNGKGGNSCHSHIFEPLFPNHSKTMMLETKVAIHVFSAVEFFFDMLLLENIISDIVPNVSNKQEKIWCKSLQWL